MPLQPGTVTDFANSMAAAMETAFKQQWPYVMGDAPVPATSEQMKLLFVAVAQGVVNHLKDHHASFKVQVNETGSGDYRGDIYEIQ
jgi:hypothetical protein